MKKINAALFALILCVSLLSVPLNLWAQEQEAVAEVNGVVITRAQFLDLLEEQFGPYALQELIQRELVNQRAEALQVSISDEEFAQVYEVIIQQLGGPQGLYMFLMQNNATEEQFKDQLRWNMLMNELASSEVEVTEEGVEQWFEANRAYYDTPEMVEVSHILVDTEEEAQEVLALLADGGDFESLAVEKSQDPGTSVAGGYLGNIERGLTVPEFEATAFSLPVGEFGLANSTYGWHIIVVHSKTDASEAVLGEIYETVERDYRSDQALDANSFMSKLETDAQIDVFWQPKF